MDPTENLTGRDRFDRRSDIIRTLYESALLVTSTNLHRYQSDKMYALYKEGYLQWVINDFNGIVNYNEDANLSSYEESLEDFIDEKLVEPDTIGFLAVDRVALMSLLNRKEFDATYLKQLGIGISKTKIIK